MRSRSLLALTVAATAALFLAGCTSAAESDPTATSVNNGGLCAAAADSGPVSESVTVEGEFGQVPTASFSTPIAVDALQRTVAITGDGTALTDGAYVSYALTVFDGDTGAQVDSAGYDQSAPLAPIPVEAGTGIDEFFGCATAGSRIVLAVPGQGETAAQVYVLDVLDVTPADQWCQVVDADAAMPTVAFDESGAPAIAIPASDPPSGVVVDVLTEGDGAVVEPGDSVTVNYTGVKWSDGTVFDSSWEKGSPATFQTTQVVSGFQRALEGQKVGSTVLVSMSPLCGYGEASVTNTNALAGETLVFVVQIISTEPAAG